MAATKIGQIVGYLTLPVIVCWSYGESPSCTSEEREVNGKIDADKVFGGLRTCFSVGLMVTIVSFLTMVVLMLIDRKRMVKLTVKNDKKSQSTLKQSFKSFKSIPTGAWYLIMVSTFFYSSLLPFISMLPDYFKQHLEFDKFQAGMMSSMMYIMSIVTAPLFGKLVDITKYHPIWIIMIMNK